MSNVIDERVVQMEFDNDQFEKNVKTTLETIEKLKKSLDLDGATEGLEEVDKAVSDVDLSSLANNVESLANRFSTLGIIGMTAISKITSSIMDLAANTISFLTNGIVNGGITRAMNLENAHFQLQGLLGDEEAVQAVMQNVNDAVTGTAYSLDAAAKVASQLVASGMQAGDELYTDLRAIAGVAAMTNSEYSEIGDIFATVAGQGRLMTQQLNQFANRGLNAAATLANYLGTTESAVREMVTAGEIDFQTFAAAMDDAFGEHATKANETFTGALANMKSALSRIGAQFVSPLIEQNGVLVNFFNTVREGFNDINESIGPVADFVTECISRIVAGVTKFLSIIDFAGPIKKLANALGNPFSDLIDKVKNFNKATESLYDATKTVTTALENFDEIVTQVIRGNFGNGQDRVEALTEAGYEWAHIQNLVNERLGDSTRHYSEYEASLDGTTTASDNAAEAISYMSVAQLESIGLTSEQAEALKLLKDAADRAGYSLEEVMNDPDLLSGKNLLLDAFQNIGSSIVKIFKAIRDAWKEVFSSDDKETNALWNIIAAFHKLSTHLVLSDEAAENLKRTFKGLFSIIDLIVRIVKGAFSLAFNGLRTMFSKIGEHLGVVNLGFGDMAGNLGDALTRFHDWVVENGYITKAFEKLGSAIGIVVEKIVAFFKWFGSLPIVSAAVDKLRESFQNLRNTRPEEIGEKISGAFKKVKEFFEPLVEKIKELVSIARDRFPLFDNICTRIETFINNVKNFKMENFGENLKKIFASIGEIDIKSLGTDVIDGFREGLGTGLISIPQFIFQLCKELLNAFRTALDSHSPSRETYAIGTDAIQGFLNAIKDKLSDVSSLSAETVSSFLSGFQNINLSDVKNSIDVDKVFSAVVSVVMLYLVKRMSQWLQALSSGIRGVSSVLFGTGRVLRAFAQELRAQSFEKIAEGIKQLAIALAILVGAFVVLIYAINDDNIGKVKIALLVIAALAAILVALTAAMSKLASSSISITKAGIQIKMVIPKLIGIAVSLLLLAAVVKIMANMDTSQMIKGFIGLGVLAGIMIGVVWAYSALVNPVIAANINKLGSMMLKLSVALLLMVAVIKLMSKITLEQVKRASVGMAAFIAAVVVLSQAASAARGNIQALGNLMLKMAVAMLLMVIVIKLIGNMDWAVLGKGLVGIGSFVAIILALTAITKLAGNSFDKLAVTLLAMSASMLIMAAVVKILGGMSVADIVKGELAITGFVGIIALLTAITRMSVNTGKLAVTILSISVCIAVMAAAVVVLSLLSPAALAKGLVAMGLMSAFISMMIAVTSMAYDCKDELIVITAAIAVMAASLAILSFIDPGKLAGAVTAMGILMGMFAVMEAMSQFTTGATSSMVAMVVVVGLLAAVIYALAQLPVDSVIGTAVSLSALLVACSAACALMSGIPAAAAAQGAIGLAAFLGIMTGVVAGIGALSLIPGFDMLIENGGETLGLVGYAIGNFVGSIIGGLGAGISSGLPEIGQNLTDFMTNISGFVEGIKNVDGSILEGVGSLSAAIIALTGAEIIAGIGNLLSFGTSYADLGLSLSQFATNALPFFMTAKSFIDKDSMEGVKALADAIMVITKAELLDRIASFGSQQTTMERFGEQLTAFGNAIVDFSTVVSDNIDNESVNAAANAGKAIAELYDAIPRSGGVFQNIFGEQDLSVFATQLSDFGSAIVAFSEAVSAEGAIDNTAVENAANAGEAVAGLYDSIPKSNGVFQNIFGEQDLSEFGDQLSSFGDAIVAFSEAVSAEGAIDSAAVENTANAGKAIAELYDSIPKSNGKFQNIFGEQDISEFGDQLSSFGKGLAKFSDNIKDKVDQEAVDAAIAAGQAVSGLYDALPEEEGAFEKFKGFFTGGGSIGMEDLTDAMVTFAKGVSEFADELPEEIDTEMITKVSTAAKRIGTMYGELGEVDFDVADTFQNAIDTLKKTFKTVNGIDVSNVDNFVDAVTKVASIDIDTSGLEATADSVASAVDSLVDSIDSTLSNGKSNVTSATEKMMDGVPTGIKNSVSSAKSAVREKLISGIKVAITSSTNTVTVTFKKLITSMIDEMSNSKSDMKTATKTMMGGVPEGITQTESSVKLAITTLISNMETVVSDKKEALKLAFKALITYSISGIRDQYSSFVAAGKYLIDGLISGLNSSDKRSQVYNAAYSLGRLAVTAELAGQNSSSPSKDTIKAGKYLGEGLIIGIDKMRNAVYSTAYGMGKNATDSISNAVANIADAVNTDIDTQPTIRPVLDLSDVRSGCDLLSEMMDGVNGYFLTGSIGVANLTLQSIENAKQDKYDNSVLSAIESLKESIDEFAENPSAQSFDNVFNIYGSNAKDIADEVSRIIQRQVERRDATWA